MTKKLTESTDFRVNSSEMDPKVPFLLLQVLETVKRHSNLHIIASFKYCTWKEDCCRVLGRMGQRDHGRGSHEHVSCCQRSDKIWIESSGSAWIVLRKSICCRPTHGPGNWVRRASRALCRGSDFERVVPYLSSLKWHSKLGARSW